MPGNKKCENIVTKGDILISNQELSVTLQAVLWEYPN
jgi:hypothetical protein